MVNCPNIYLCQKMVGLILFYIGEQIRYSWTVIYLTFHWQYYFFSFSTGLHRLTFDSLSYRVIRFQEGCDHWGTLLLLFDERWFCGNPRVYCGSVSDIISWALALVYTGSCLTLISNELWEFGMVETNWGTLLLWFGVRESMRNLQDILR